MENLHKTSKCYGAVVRSWFQYYKKKRERDDPVCMNAGAPKMRPRKEYKEGNPA